MPAWERGCFVLPRALWSHSCILVTLLRAIFSFQGGSAAGAGASAGGGRDVEDPNVVMCKDMMVAVEPHLVGTCGVCALGACLWCMCTQCVLVVYVPLVGACGVCALGGCLCVYVPLVGACVCMCPWWVLVCVCALGGCLWCMCA
jgi:hypothetical protein